MRKSKIAFGSLLVFVLSVISVITVCAQIPTWEEREAISGLNSEYQQNWRSGYMQLPEIDDPAEGEPALQGCFRKEFDLPAAPRHAELTLFVPGRDRAHPYWFAVNGVEVEGLRWGKYVLGGLRNLDITEYLRPGRNVLTFRADTRRAGGRPPRSENWLLAEGIVFCEDGSTYRILTDGWQGGWNPSEGWDDPAVAVATNDMPELRSGRGGQVTAPVSAMGGDVYMRPYYGPIQARPVLDMHDASAQPIFNEEDQVVIDITLLNMAASATGDRVALTGEIMDQQSRKVLSNDTITLTKAGKLDLSGRLDLGRPGKGTYRCRFVLTVDGEEFDRRDYEVAVVGEIQQRLVDGTHYEDGLDLKKVWEIDCTVEPEDGMFVAAHTDWNKTPEGGVQTIVKDGADGRYRELVPGGRMLYFAYQYRLQNVYTPHLAVVEWPDDVKRNFVVHVTEESTFTRHRRGGLASRGHQRSESSITTFHDLHPERSGKMQKLHLLFWPNAGRGGVHFVNLGGGEAPVAAARITIYEITNDLPALRIADAGDRLIGPHTERGPQTMSAAYYAGPMGNYFTASLGAIDHPEFYRNWMTTADNFIKRMRFEGQNMYLMGHLMYEGTLYPSRMSEYGYRQDNYFGNDAVRDYVTLLLRMFERNGIYMYSGIEHRFVSAFARAWGVSYIPSADEITAGAEHAQLIKRDGTFGGSPNYLHPYIQEGIVAMVGELADLYGRSPAWKGITFILGCAHGGFGPIDMAAPGISSLEEMLEYGYEDLTVAMFEDQTGIKIPVPATAPDRYEQRYQWIIANAREEWIQWRCDQYTDLWRRIRDRMTEVDPGLELLLNMGEPMLSPWTRMNILDDHYDDPDYTLRLMRKIGFDVETLRQENNIRIVKSYMLAGGGGAAGSGRHEGWRELNRNQDFQSLFANDDRGGVYMYSGIPHYGGYIYPWSRDEDERIWLWDRLLTRQSWIYSTYVVESFVNVMARSNPTLIQHTWMDVNESMGRIHEKRLFARAYRSLPNGKYERLTGNGLDNDLWVSRTVKDGAEYVYAANLHWWNLETTLTFAPGTRVHDLIADKPVELQDNAWTFALGPYQIQTFRVERGGLLRRLMGQGARPGGNSNVEGGKALIDEHDRVQMERQFEEATGQASAAITESRAREDEFSSWPVWDTVAVLDQRLQSALESKAAGDMASAYTGVIGGEFPMLREEVVSGLLQAMPILVLGPFGSEADTPPDHPRGVWTGSAEVAPEFRGMETPFLDEFAGEDGERLRDGFQPDTASVHTVYGGRESSWRTALNTSYFTFAPHANSESPYWMTSYAYAEIYSPETREAVLRAGSDHAFWIWINDQRVLRHGGHGTHRGGQRPGVVGQDTAKVKLEAGWNRMLIKAVQRGEARFMLQFTDEAGRPLTDLRYRVPDAA